MTTVAAERSAIARRESTDTSSVFGTLSRREPFCAPAEDGESVWLQVAAQRREPSAIRAVIRTLRWFVAIAEMLGRAIADAIRGRRTDRDRGRRLRRLFERMGGTAVKVGQQMSVRIDLLPYDVCDELATLQDAVPPFPVAEAIARIEKTTGRKLEEIFSAFDPEPIGSASIACVYRATLRGGEAVAVKVRRPGIVTQFLTDLRFIDWLTTFFEAIALVKPGFFKHLRAELREMLMEELDFAREARYQRLFRRETKKARLKWLSAPKVYSELCSEDVIVSEYVDGIWCRELLAAVASGDRAALAKIDAMGISPRKVARRLLYAQFWSSYESLFFHADPHPSNILILPGSRVLFLDFGACGTTSAHVRRYQQALLDHLVENNVSGMVAAAVHLLSPLPPIDIDELERRIEATYHRQVFALRDRKAEWWERTTMGLWLAMVNVTQELNLPMNLDVIRQFRSSLLYDTLAFRLDPDLELARLYRRYRRESIARAAKRALSSALKPAPQDSREQMIDRVAHGLDGARDAMREAETLMHGLPVAMESAVNKGAYAAKVALYFLLAACAVVGCAALALGGVDLLRILRNPIVVVLLALLAIKTVRHLFFRLGERDSQTGARLPWR